MKLKQLHIGAACSYFNPSDHERHHPSIPVAAGEESALRTRLGLSWNSHRTEGIGKSETRPEVNGST